MKRLVLGCAALIVGPLLLVGGVAPFALSAANEASEATAALVTTLPPEADLVLEGVTVLDPVDGPRPSARVLLSKGKIVGIDDATGPVPGGARVLSLEGRYVLPGLIDTHVHLGQPAELDLLRFLAHGVVLVRDMGDISGNNVTLAERVRRERLSLAGLVPCSRPLDRDPPVTPGSFGVTTEEQARAFVAAEAARGAKCLKTYHGLSPALLRAAATEARKHGMPVVGHVPAVFVRGGEAPHRMTAAEARRMGLEEVQHLMGIAVSLEGGGAPMDMSFGIIGDELTRFVDAPQQQLDAIAAAHASLDLRHTPTLSLATSARGIRAGGAAPKSVAGPLAEFVWPALGDYLLTPKAKTAQLEAGIEGAQRAVRALHEAGVPILAGTDSGVPWVVAGDALHTELRMLVDAGLSPREAIAAATSTAALALGVSKTHGRVAPGFAADLIVVRGDAFTNIDHTRELEHVIRSGALLTPKRLQADVMKAKDVGELPWSRFLARVAGVAISTLGNRDTPGTADDAYPLP